MTLVCSEVFHQKIELEGFNETVHKISSLLGNNPKAWNKYLYNLRVLIVLKLIYDY
jgi:hypothetical protein